MRREEGSGASPTNCCQPLANSRNNQGNSLKSEGSERLGDHAGLGFVERTVCLAWDSGMSCSLGLSFLPVLPEWESLGGLPPVVLPAVCWVSVADLRPHPGTTVCLGETFHAFS